MRILLTTIAAILLLIVERPGYAADAVGQPNVVLILADDLGIGDLGCYNPRSKIPTPHVDRFAESAMRFTDTHSPSAVCTPTRYGLLTGRYAWRTRLKSGVLWGYSRSLIEPGRMTLASLLAQHGYHTAAVGKWHLGFQAFDPWVARPDVSKGVESKAEQDQPVDYAQPLRPGPRTVGFDRFFGIPASLDMDPYLFVVDDRPVEQPSGSIAASRHRRQGGNGFWRAGPIAPSFQHVDVLPKIAEQAMAFIDERARGNGDEPENGDRGRPFFLYVPLSAPHTPWLPTEPFRGKSQAGYYGDFVTQVDDAIGQVLEALGRNNLSENTLVIVTSDNGSHWPASDIAQWDHRANLHYRGQKADIHEGGHRVPLLVRWPGEVKPNTTCDVLVCLTDCLATFAEMLGDSLPDDAGEDSVSFLPALRGDTSSEKSSPGRTSIVHHSGDGMFAIREENWKLILGLGSGGFTKPAMVKAKPGEPSGQLYNLRDDPGETKNVYAEHPKIVARLTALLDQYRREGRSR